MAKFKVWATGDVPTATELNELWQQQVLIRGTAAELVALASPAEGWHGAATDTDRIMIYDGSAWVRLAHYAAAGRTGCSVSRNATQSISNSSNTAISFDAEAFDSDGFITPTSATIVIPAGLGGQYAVSLAVDWAADPGASRVGIVATVGGATRHWFSELGSASAPTAHVMGVSVCPLVLSAADQITTEVRQVSGGALNITKAHLELYRIGL